MNTPVAKKATQVELIHEDKPSGMIWIVFLIGAVILLAVAFAGFPPKGVKDWALLTLMPLLSVGVFWMALKIFQSRHDSQKYYSDRVEFYVKGVLTQTLPYGEVTTVAYGFTGDGKDQFVSLSGPAGKPRASLNLVGGDGKAPGDLTEAKLTRIRDLLYAAVSRRMLKLCTAEGGVSWFKQLRITRAGLLDGVTLIPWADVEMRSNDSTGEFRVVHNGSTIARTSMIEDNVVAGMIAVERLKGVSR